MNVILLGFNSGKNTESHSEFKNVDNCYEYQVDSYEEQSCLIHNATRCVFFTEGDFRSHTYIPPALGKDVYTIASKEVYQLHSANDSTIKYWNENVFKFGGQIKPLVYEEIYESDESLNKGVKKIMEGK